MIASARAKLINSIRSVWDRIQSSPERFGNFRLGVVSALSVALAPFGRRAARFHQRLAAYDRREHGLIIVLPGIEGISSVNDGITRGLAAAGLPHSMIIHDWRRYRIWSPLHLASEQHNRQQARVVVDIVVDYQRNFPGRPVHLIGHSAGSGVALFVLESLPDDVKVQSVILLAAAVSRRIDAESLAERTIDGIWNFYSALDMPTVGLGTLIFGTTNRRHEVSAGALGFIERSPKSESTGLFQIRFRPHMMRDWNLGGHFGATNSAFVRHYIAPLLQSEWSRRSSHGPGELISVNQSTPVKSFSR